MSTTLGNAIPIMQVLTKKKQMPQQTASQEAVSLKSLMGTIAKDKNSDMREEEASRELKGPTSTRPPTGDDQQKSHETT